MKKCSLAIDIGASGGKVMAGYLEGSQLELIQVHRFENKIIERNYHFCWDIKALFEEVKRGIHKCKEFGLHPKSIGVDTWAVDFVLLDENDELLTETISYRDSRTDGLMEEVHELLSRESLYAKTGIQFQKFNTIYQLHAINKENPNILKKAKSFLMIPDYLHFLLSGIKVNEYTNATTTQLVNAKTKQWDETILDKLNINKEMFHKILPPKTYIGNLKPEFVQEFGFDMQVLLPSTHDTGSAVVAVPEVEKSIYISSGTWSLIGVENNFPISNSKAMNYNFTNEGGFDYRFRFLKNIMGIWMIQEVKKDYHNKYDFQDFVSLARKESQFYSILNVNDDRFLKPINMIEEIKNYCEETEQDIPSTPGQVAKCVFDSLAQSYLIAISQIEEMLGEEFYTINIIGGGSQNDMLNQLIANTTNKRVIAGPVEATSIGNIVSQLISLKLIDWLAEARELIKHSFNLSMYEQENNVEGLN